MDRILSYLPENVHVRFGWDNGPLYYNSPINDITYRTIVIPKTWLKHGERGSYHEWEIKKTYNKKLANAVGEHFLHSTERLEVLEWNQLESVCYILKKADKIGFDNILEIAKTVNEADIHYTHNINV